MIKIHKREIIAQIVIPNNLGFNLAFRRLILFLKSLHYSSITKIVRSHMIDQVFFPIVNDWRTSNVLQWLQAV